MRYEFAEVMIDGDARELVRDGRRVHVSGKAFDLLLFLIEQRPRALARHEIHDRLWPDTFVGDASLPVLIREIRAALGSGARGAIRTIHRFGYAFDAEVRELGRHARTLAVPLHVLVHAEREFPLVRGENIIGRDPAAHVFVPSSSVSRQHAAITTDGESAVISDLRSKNGTRVAGELVERPTPLRDGDVVTFGAIEMLYHCLYPNAPTESLES